MTTAKHLVRRGWRGLWPLTQTLDTDRFRQQRTAAAIPPRGRARTIAVLGASQGCGATTLTVLLAAIAHSLQGRSPALLAAGASAALRDRAAAHLPEPHDRQPDVSLIDAADALTALPDTPSIFVDAPLQSAHTDPAFFAQADVVVVVNTADQASILAARSLVAWLQSIRAHHIIQVTSETTRAARPQPKDDRVLPYDPVLQHGVVALERLDLATLDAAVSLLAVINGAD